MFELLQITAQYSNAVLLAILPHFSDLAQKLDLQLPVPITPEHVWRFNCDPRKGQFGGWVVLTNGYEFWFEHGFAYGFSSPRSYASLQDPKLIPTFFGRPKINESQALEFARDGLTRLGYSLKATYADLKPQRVTVPEQIDTNLVPYYRFEWEHPLEQGTAVDIEINAVTKTVESLKIFNSGLWREPPKIAVSAQPIPRINVPIAPDQSNSLVRALLPQFTDFAKNFELPLVFPLTIDQVERVEFIDNSLDLWLKLTNGYWFTYQLSQVRGFSAPNSFYQRWIGEGFKPIEQYLGKWRLTEEQAIKLARDTIRKAGYTENDFEAFKAPAILKPKQVGDYVIPRCLIRWSVWNPKMASTLSADAQIEVDADTKTIKYVYFFSGKRKTPDYE